MYRKLNKPKYKFLKYSIKGRRITDRKSKECRSFLKDEYAEVIVEYARNE